MEVEPWKPVRYSATVAVSDEEETVLEAGTDGLARRFGKPEPAVHTPISKACIVDGSAGRFGKPGLAVHTPISEAYTIELFSSLETEGPGPAVTTTVSKASPRLVNEPETSLL